MLDQLALFDSGPSEPEGWRYAPGFVSTAIQEQLIMGIRSLPLRHFSLAISKGNRRVASFGFQYDYALRQLREAEPIPAWLTKIIAEVEKFGGPGIRIQQVLCTEYDIGVGIGWHRDKPHFDKVFGLSLGSACKLRFRRTAGKTWDRFTLGADPGSLYMMTGASRRIWEHSIPPVEALSYSVTFRTMTSGLTSPAMI